MKNALRAFLSYIRSPNCLCLALYFTLSLFIFALWSLKNWPLNSNPRCQLEAYFNLSAHKPFVFRLLIPWLAVVLSALIPQGFEDALINRIPALYHLALKFNSKSIASVLPFWLSLILAWTSLFAWCFAIRNLFRHLYKDVAEISWLVPVVGLLFLPIFSIKGSPYIYDYPTLLGSTLLFICMFTRRWRTYAILFLVFCFNKETTVLFLVPWFFYFLNFLKLKQLAQGVAFHLGIWISIRAFMTWQFTNNRGVTVENHFFGNLSRIWNSEFWFSFDLMIALATLVFLIFANWSQKPLLLRRGMWLFALLIPLYIYAGYWNEIRVFYEGFPLLLILSLDTILRLAGYPLQTNLEPQTRGIQVVQR